MIKTHLRNQFKPNLEEIALYIGSFTEGLLDGFIAISIPIFVGIYLINDIGFPEPVISGFLLSIGPVFDSVLLPIIGKYSDNSKNYKSLIKLGRFLVNITLMAFVVARSLWLGGILRIIQGVGNAYLLPSSLALISNRAEIENRTVSQGYQTTFRVVGGALGPILGGIANSMLSIQQSFFIMAIIWFVGSVTIEFFVRETKKEVSISKQSASTKTDGKLHLNTKDMISLGSVMVITSYLIYMISSIQSELIAKLDQTTFVFSVVFSIPSVTRIILQIPIGYFIKHLKPKIFLVAGILLLIVSVLGMIYTSTTIELMLYRFIQGIGVSMTMVTVLGMISVASSSNQIGRNMGISTACFSVGMCLGPFTTGLLASYLSTSASYYFSLILCGLALIAVIFLLRSYNLKDFKEEYINIM